MSTTIPAAPPSGRVGGALPPHRHARGRSGRPADVPGGGARQSGEHPGRHDSWSSCGSAAAASHRHRGDRDGKPTADDAPAQPSAVASRRRPRRLGAGDRLLADNGRRAGDRCGACAYAHAGGRGAESARGELAPGLGGRRSAGCKQTRTLRPPRPWRATGTGTGAQTIRVRAGRRRGGDSHWRVPLRLHKRARRPRVAGTEALRGAASASSPTPIVTTITKIVGVVPTLVWALIGGLLALALALGVRSRLAALRARRLEQQRGELLEDVGLLQAALLPVAPDRLGPVGTSAAYRPADGPGAGGDFYDLFALEDGRLAVILGDVSGHGRQALPHTALVRFTLRAYLEAGLSPRGAVQTAGAVLERQLGESFATVVAAIYHPRERTLTYACAGHPPPIVLGSRAIEPITVCSAPPIGAGARTGTRQTVVSVPGRAQICFHTDGVTEARVGAELFGAQRLTQTLAELGPRTSAQELLERVAAQTDARPDDMAACLLSVEGARGRPRACSWRSSSSTAR